MAILFLTSFLVSLDPKNVIPANRIIAGLCFVHGMIFLLLHGRHRVTATGLFMAASAVFIGLSGWIGSDDLSSIEIPSPRHYLYKALFMATLAQIGIGVLASLRPQPSSSPDFIPIGKRSENALKALGLLSLVFVWVLGENLGPLREGFAFSAAAVLSVTALLSREGLTTIQNIVLTTAPTLLYLTVFHDGTGRLRVIALAGAVGFTFFLRYGRRWMKLMAVLLFPIALVLMGVWRQVLQLRNFGAVGQDSGLDSMVASVRIFATLIHEFENGLEPVWGLSFLSPIQAALPADLVPQWMPQGLGYELAALVAPESVGSGFSTVASVYGDWYWNFSVLGIFLAIPVLALLLAWLDGVSIRSYSKTAGSSLHVLGFVFWASLVGGLGDLAWSGFHTWIVRMYARAALLVVFALAMIYFEAATRTATSRGGAIPQGSGRSSRRFPLRGSTAGGAPPRVQPRPSVFS